MFSSQHIPLRAPDLVPHNHKISRPIISPTNPVESTLPPPPASVHSELLTATLSSLESTLTKKRRGGQLLLTRHVLKHVCPEEHRDAGSRTRSITDLVPKRRTDPRSFFVAGFVN